MTIEWTTFAIRLLVGLFLAIGIGIERQWLKTRSILKTNVLVTLGSAMFVMLSIMTPGDASPTRISAQIVSGVGFLGGGVILREGASVKGINTAATLWCAAAIGTLVGSGYLVQAYVSTLIVVGANLLLRPLAEAFKQRDRSLVDSLSLEEASSNSVSVEYDAVPVSENSKNKIVKYSCTLVCPTESEIQILELINNFARQKKLVLTELRSNTIGDRKIGSERNVEIRLILQAQASSEQIENFVEPIQILKSKAAVDSVDWQVIQ